MIRCALVRLEHRVRADERRDDAAAVDVADEDHRHIGRLGEAHIGDVAGAKIDLGRRARAFDEDEVGVASSRPKLSSTCGISSALARAVFARLQRRPALALHDHLRAGLRFRLQQHRVHVDGGRDPRGARLQHLRAADLAAVRGDAALFDMFCGLNGATFMPRSAKARQSPATISDLPTLEPVPWNMIAAVGVMPLLYLIVGILRIPQCRC